MEVQKINLCTGCLAVDRRMILINSEHKQRCFLQIIKELPITVPESLPLWLCWECEASIKRFTKFKLQVQNSYQVLHDMTFQNDTSQCRPKLSIHEVTSVTLPPDTDDRPVTVKTEDIVPPIKYETDFSDNDNNEDNKQTSLTENPMKIDENHKMNMKAQNRKVKRNGKVKVKKKFYNEIDLTEEEIAEERNKLALRDDYVNAMFRCGKCLISFPNEDDMKEHAFKKHELHASKYKCSICERSFSTEVAYSYHRSRHYRRYKCVVCSYSCTSQLAVRNHCAAMHLHSVAVKKMLKNHELADNDLNGRKSSQRYSCEHCPKVFGWKTSLRKHAETHKIEAGQKRRPYCEPCRLSFTTTANLQKHVKTSSKHQIQLKLRKLKETDPAASSDKQIEDIKSSVNSTRELFPCEQCDKKFQWRGNLIRHMDSHAARAKGELVCEPCKRTFSSIATYKQHMKISKKHATENDFKYMCSDCGKKFASKTKLKDHVDWEHLKNFVHTCTECQKVFKTHTSLYLHRQVVHKKSSAQHLCENCGKSFPNQTKLRSHMIAIHTSESPYKCGECGARFSWHSCLSRHLRRVHRTK